MKYKIGIIAFMIVSGLLTVGGPGSPDIPAAENAGRIVGAALAPLLFGAVVFLVVRLVGKGRAPGSGQRVIFWTMAVVFLLQVANLGLSGAGSAASRAITDAERQALEVGPDSIRHAGFGFALPSPGAAYQRSAQMQHMLDSQFVQQPNVGGWALANEQDGGVVILLVTKSRVNETILRAFAKGIRKGVGDAGMNVLEDTLEWRGATGEYRYWAQTRTYRYLGIRCLPGTRREAPAIVCVETVSASPRGDDELQFVRTGLAVGR